MNVANVIALSSAVVSVIALVVAGLSLRHTARQAEAAESGNDLGKKALALAERLDHRELRREHYGRAPTYRADLDGDVLRLWLEDGEQLSKVDAEVVHGRGVRFKDSQDGVSRSDQTRAIWAKELVSGQPAMWRLEIDDDRDPQISLQIKSWSMSSSDDPWGATVVIDVPPTPMFYAFTDEELPG
jgi:hypothetical protein